MALDIVSIEYFYGFLFCFKFSVILFVGFSSIMSALLLFSNFELNQFVSIW